MRATYALFLVLLKAVKYCVAFGSGITFTAKILSRHTSSGYTISYSVFHYFVKNRFDLIPTLRGT